MPKFTVFLIFILLMSCLAVGFALNFFQLTIYAPEQSTLAYTATAAENAAIRTQQASKGATVVASNLQNIHAAATAQSAQATADAFHLLATATASERIAQTQAADLYATQVAAQSTSTAAAEQLIATRQAQATATAQAWMLTGWTATAEAAHATSTAQAQATATAQARWVTSLTVTADAAHSTATAQAQATLDQFTTRSLQRAEEREKLVNNLVALTPYLAAALVFLVILWLLIKVIPVFQERLRDRAPDAAGRYPLIADGHGNVYDPDRNPYPLIQMGPAPSIPLLTQTPLQPATTERDQSIDLATRGFPSQQQRAPSSRAMPPSTSLIAPPAVNSHIYAPAEIPPEFSSNPDLLEILEAQWREIK